MKFDTAILYDIENLMGGYGKAGYLSELSLKDIFEEIEKKDISGIAVQRAYANWGDARLNILRGDIVELGIEPIQMFGFGRGPNKNASDIQLVIDAVEIALTNKVVENFVIVSGDGGFSALAKKLHEYGKMVVGCAYAKATNKVFEAVCDQFIWIDLPEIEQNKVNTQYKKVTSSSANNGNPILYEFSKKYDKINSKQKDRVFKEAETVFQFILDSNTTKNAAKNSGVNISVFHQLINYRIIDFEFIRYGFARSVDFIRYTIKNSNAKLVLKEPSDYRIISKNTSLPGFKDVDVIEEEPIIHSRKGYELLLLRSQPRFPLSSPDVIYEITNYLVENKTDFINKLYGDIVDIISEKFEHEQKAIRGVITSLVSSSCFVELEDKKQEERFLSFACVSVEDAMKKLRESIQNTLLDMLGEIKTEEIDLLIPEL